MDIVLYRNYKNKDIIEISEILHKSIVEVLSHTFENNFNYVYLSKIRDYYKTDVFFDSNAIVDFINELKVIINELDDIHKTSMIYIIDKISKKDIVKIHISGD